MSWKNNAYSLAGTIMLAFSTNVYAQQTMPPAPVREKAEQNTAPGCGRLFRIDSITEDAVFECVVTTMDQASDYSQKLEKIAGKEKSLPVDEITEKILDLFTKDDCINFAFARAALGMETILEDNGRINKPLTIIQIARMYFSTGSTCYAETAEILSQYDVLKDLARDYCELSGIMREAGFKLPQLMR